QRDTLVRIFSMTKPITGVVLMTFYEEGLFDLDDPLAKHLPEYADIEVYAGEAEGQVRLETPARPPTIRDILRHTAGFANGDDGDRSWVDHRYREVEPGNIENTLEQMSVKLASVPLLFEPGTRWYYGPSVDVQARLVEVLGGKPYEVVLRERVLEPLRMHDTQYTLREDQRERISALYERQPDGSFERVGNDISLAFNIRDWPMKPGGWGLTSSLDDYMRFARMLLNGGALDGVRILQPETVRLMATDALPAELKDRWWLVNKGQVGFGMDFAVRVAPPADQAEASGAVGEFFWDGLANTLFWVDAENDIAAVLFNHYVPFGKTEIQKTFRDAVYHGDETATALNKAPARPDSPRLSD
ncbi:MAG TPA: serine hydrolase domain-containing protein, partial [Woeseiaceae bacterium]